MDNEKKLTDFENEYYFEINNYVVRDKDLIAAKVPQKVLAYEVYLRKAFGDSFAKTTADDDYDGLAKRKVEKLTKDKLDNSELNTIIEEINTSEFDDNVDIILRT
ncbi:MAG: hypothetical protein IJA23_00725 [Clostridia bacterium]|nr:hypothetical protein [Clostridia bacterium]